MRHTSLYFLLLFVLVVNGCAVVLQRGRRSDIERIASLESELSALQSAKEALESQLAQEIADKQVSLEMAERGLVITFVAEVLFDSGKATLREDSMPMLDKVAAIIEDKVPGNNIGIEGHTDNQPIRVSGWKNNWELSAQRALNVLYYLEEQGLDPARLSASGYGEYRPIESNDTDEGKQKNRRVEIVILPKKTAAPLEPVETPQQQQEEELK